MNKGFTLIEILIALVIMAVLVGTAVLSVSSGLKSARLRDAARVVAYYTRHAKAVALLKQKPVVITFEEIIDVGEFTKSRVSIDFAADAQSSSSIGAALGGGTDGQARTLSGALVSEIEGGGDVLSTGDEEGDDPLAVEPKEFEGIHVQAELRDEEQERRPRISVFSNVDALRRQSTQSREKAKKSENEQTAKSADADSSDGTENEVDEETSLSVVYEANGRCTPYRITIWKDGAEKEDGIVINIGQFGRPVTEP